MEAIYCYSFVEDTPSAAVLRRLVEYRNQTAAHELHFLPGFPQITRGNGNLKKKCPGLLAMAKSGATVVCLTDLDSRPCPGALLTDWFNWSRNHSSDLPKNLIFRIAVREIESWIVADRDAWATFIGIPAANFTQRPDELPDPKQSLLRVLSAKGKKKLHVEMLPRGTAHVGPRYNEVLCRFIESEWAPERASECSPSLKRAIQALESL